MPTARDTTDGASAQDAAPPVDDNSGSVTTATVIDACAAVVDERRAFLQSLADRNGASFQIYIGAIVALEDADDRIRALKSHL